MRGVQERLQMAAVRRDEFRQRKACERKDKKRYVSLIYHSYPSTVLTGVAPSPPITPIPEIPQRMDSPAVSEASNTTIKQETLFLDGGLPPIPSIPQSTFPTNPEFSGFGEMYPLIPRDSTPYSSPYASNQTPMSLDGHIEPSSASSCMSMFDDKATLPSAGTSISSGRSPSLADILLPGTDLHAAPSPEYLSWRAQYPEELYAPAIYEPGQGSINPAEPLFEDDVEEIPRDFEAESNWAMRLPSPSPSSSSGSSDGSLIASFLKEPIFDAGSPEMLTRRFDRQTCGILSIKDGPTENPWRTLVWPLARDCPALYHAIASMTCFHVSNHKPRLRLPGIEHMRTSIHELAGGIANMRFDAAIASTLVLAFAESWDQHTSTGINHIKGAKILVNQALVQHRKKPLVGDDLDRFKFLCNTWIYMDVISRLTSIDEDESNDFDVVQSMVSGPWELETNLDPLMGCASTLFPIIGRVANLVRKVRRVKSNSPAIISQAMELKGQLEEWTPPGSLYDPEDQSSPVVHNMQTAEAYRWATLLYLHQAVPEIPSEASAELARKVLVCLATVPITSRAVIVQIYPLTAAGCEAVDAEDRDWVRDRWANMSQRMVIGILDRCVEVTKEVWDRRDAWEADRLAKQSSVTLKRSSSGFTGGPTRTISLKRELTLDDEVASDPYGWGLKTPSLKKRALSNSLDVPRPVRVLDTLRANSKTEPLDPEFTVRGRLHWLGVMNDWKWESKFSRLQNHCGKLTYHAVLLG
jgi:hypothetical protein